MQPDMVWITDSSQSNESMVNEIMEEEDTTKGQCTQEPIFGTDFMTELNYGAGTSTIRKAQVQER